MCFVVWKHMWKYILVKKYVKIRVMLFKNWKHVFKLAYQMGLKFQNVDPKQLGINQWNLCLSIIYRWAPLESSLLFPLIYFHQFYTTMVGKITQTPKKEKLTQLNQLYLHIVPRTILSAPTKRNCIKHSVSNQSINLVQ